MTHSPQIPFSTINNILIFLILLLSFFKAACYANPGAERNFAGSN